MHWSFRLILPLLNKIKDDEDKPLVESIFRTWSECNFVTEITSHALFINLVYQVLQSRKSWRGTEFIELVLGSLIVADKVGNDETSTQVSDFMSHLHHKNLFADNAPELAKLRYLIACEKSLLRAIQYNPYRYLNLDGVIKLLEKQLSDPAFIYPYLSDCVIEGEMATYFYHKLPLPYKFLMNSLERFLNNEPGENPFSKDLQQLDEIMRDNLGRQWSTHAKRQLAQFLVRQDFEAAAFSRAHFHSLMNTLATELAFYNWSSFAVCYYRAIIKFLCRDPKASPDIEKIYHSLDHLLNYAFDFKDQDIKAAILKLVMTVNEATALQLRGEIRPTEYLTHLSLARKNFPYKGVALAYQHLDDIEVVFRRSIFIDSCRDLSFFKAIFTSAPSQSTCQSNQPGLQA